ncbi:TlpA family protein disulfide reductase [bacterium]|nr:TlpA family protein disulfide reductase [bacterium]
MRKFIIIMLVSFIMSCGSVQKTPSASSPVQTPEKKSGQTAESQQTNAFSLELETTDGEPFSYQSIAGKKGLLISFWATWCEPCKAELTQLAELYPKYKEDFEIIAISIDPEDNMDAVQEFAVEMALPFPVLVDPSGNVTSGMIPGGDTVPYSMLIDKNGKIVATHTGYEPGDEKRIEEEIQKLLR